jgi:DNA-binding response OmpR family regulator
MDTPVESAADGLAGQELAEQNAFDLIILDVMLPSRSGFDVCRYLRKNGIQTPILMLTARSELNNKVQGFKAGADDYLTNHLSLQNCRCGCRHCFDAFRRKQKRKSRMPSLAAYVWIFQSPG